MLGCRFQLKTGLLGVMLAVAALLAGCGSTHRRPPVQDLGVTSTQLPPPGVENAGKPGYYTVQPGDTIRRIAANNNRDWRDIARWNNLSNPDKIEVGQVVRIVPPGRDAGAAGNTPVAVATQTTPGTAVGAAQTASATPPAATPGPAVPPASSGAADKIDFMWPAKGAVLAGFDEAKSIKGIDIGGEAGDPVYAAADGRVIFAGEGPLGFGKLVIIKHNDTFLTAYGNNQTILIKEDRNVKKGQKIAEMGSTGAHRVQLHFEIRRLGRPVNPAQYLPSR